MSNEKSPYELGVIAYNTGYSAFTNPFLRYEDNELLSEYIDWFKGWEDSKRAYFDKVIGKLEAQKFLNDDEVK